MDISASKEDSRPKIDLRQAKFDIQKFNIKGLASTDKEQAKVDFAISLGAKVIFLIIGLRLNFNNIENESGGCTSKVSNRKLVGPQY